MSLAKHASTNNQFKSITFHYSSAVLVLRWLFQSNCAISLTSLRGFHCFKCLHNVLTCQPRLLKLIIQLLTLNSSKSRWTRSLRSSFPADGNWRSSLQRASGSSETQPLGSSNELTTTTFGNHTN